MTLLEQTYLQLRDTGLVKCAEDFSRNYLGKNKNWYAFQTHNGRTFSVSAAVQCLRSIREQQSLAELGDSQNAVLDWAEVELLTYLNETHLVADVCA